MSLSRAGLIPISTGGYSRLFTELIELVINYSYVFVLSNKRNSSGQSNIAPTSSDELNTHGVAYRLYSLFFPILQLISKLDRFLPEDTNNAVIVSAVKPSDQDVVTQRNFR
jgi:hypothetical protein